MHRIKQQQLLHVGVSAETGILEAQSFRPLHPDGLGWTASIPPHYQLLRDQLIHECADATRDGCRLRVRLRDDALHHLFDGGPALNRTPYARARAVKRVVSAGLEVDEDRLLLNRLVHHGRAVGPEPPPVHGQKLASAVEGRERPATIGGVRTLYFVESFWPAIGGVEVISASLVSLLAERGHDVMVVTNQAKPGLARAEPFGDVAVRRVPFIRALHGRDLKLLAEARVAMSGIVREHRPELIHAAFTGPGVWLLAPDAAAPLIVSLHGSWPNFDFGAGDSVAAQTLSRAAWVTTCSQSALSDLLATAPHLKGRSSVIHNGLDPIFHHEPPPPPEGAPRLLCAGRIAHEKGMDVAIDALGRVVRTIPDVRLTIAGDGPERGALEERAKDLGVTEHVEFLGWVEPERMHEVMARCFAVIVPSRREGFGLAALEAALAARPVVASKVGGLPEVVDDGATGILVTADDSAATATAIEHLLAAPSRAHEMGLAARSRALQRFGARQHADAWEALYKRVAVSRGAAAAGPTITASDDRQ